MGRGSRLFWQCGASYLKPNTARHLQYPEIILGKKEGPFAFLGELRVLCGEMPFGRLCLGREKDQTAPLPEIPQPSYLRGR
jgi:hypothetical protein